jgi:ADP-ribose pyrophosphatase YjhB (NUDIX family)
VTCRYWDHNWSPPGGRVRQGDGFAVALTREAFEEAGLDGVVLMPVGLWSDVHDGCRQRDITFVCIVRLRRVVLSEEHRGLHVGAT